MSSPVKWKRTKTRLRNVLGPLGLLCPTQDQWGVLAYSLAGLQLSLSTLSPGTPGSIWEAADWRMGPGHPQEDQKWRKISRRWAEVNRNKTRSKDGSGKRHNELILLEQRPKARVIPEELGSAQGQTSSISQLYQLRPAQQAIPSKDQELKSQ